MIKSMTGFSKAEARKDGIGINVEFKSLNGRNLDINCKMPRAISEKELEVRNFVRKNLSRGTITIYINLEQDETKTPFGFDHEAASVTHQALVELRKHLKVKDAVKMENVLQFHEHFIKTDTEQNTELIWQLTKDALTDAIKQLNTMRKKEGSLISKDVQKRMKNIQDLVEEIEKIGIEQIPETREKYKEKIAKLFENDEIDESRLQTEIVLLSDKLDISEECVRLSAHIKQFNDTVKENESIGRKLTFLCQEMNREINTIASKCNNSRISHLAVIFKEELERVREQAQNIE